MSKDYVKPVAKAYADGIGLEEVAQRQLREIDNERLQLQSQAALIRQLQALGSKSTAGHQVRPRPESASVKEADDGSVPVVAEASGRLSEVLKERIKEIWTETMQREGRDLSAPQVVQLLTAQGVNFGVEKPWAAVGTVLYAVRNSYNASGQTSISDVRPDQLG